MKKLQRVLFTTTSSILFVWACYAQDPPTRVADLNYLDGNVSMQPAGADDWAPAFINRPFTTGDNLWADTDSHAELHTPHAVMRLGPQTSIGFLNLGDHVAQFRFSQGEFILRVRRLAGDEIFEVDTPNAALTVMQPGEYRFNADPDSGTTWAVARHGQLQVTGGGQSFILNEGNSAQLTGSDQLAFNVQYAPDPDWLEGWSEDRDARESRLMASRYLSPEVIGYEELDNYGTWRDMAGYGPVWYPSVDASWAPYRTGSWSWIEPWGWTWVDDAPWGFAPSHYGRWAYMGGGWGWIPGPLAIGGAAMAPVYAPALVAFIGGGGFGLSLSIGGPAIGWVPLGPGEIYAPAYQVSAGYFRTVNVSSTTIVNQVNITNVYNNVYVNKTASNVTINEHFANMTAPNAVSAMPQNAFASGRPVKQAGIVVPANQAAQLRPASMAVAPSVAPVKQALAPNAGSRPASHPPARAMSAPVVAKQTPPPPPVSFASKQAGLQQNLGRPVNMQAIRQSVPPRPVASAPVVRVAPPARTVTPTVQPAKAAPPTNKPGAPAFRPTSAPPPAQPVNRPPAQPVAQPAQPIRPTTPPPVQPRTTPPAQPVNRPPAQPATPPAQPHVTPPPAQPKPVTPAPAQPKQPPQKPKKETKKEEPK